MVCFLLFGVCFWVMDITLLQEVQIKYYSFITLKNTSRAIASNNIRFSNLPSTSSVLLVLLAEPWDTASLQPEIPENLEECTSKWLCMVCPHQSVYGMSEKSNRNKISRLCYLYFFLPEMLFIFSSNVIYTILWCTTYGNCNIQKRWKLDFRQSMLKVFLKHYFES